MSSSARNLVFLTAVLLVGLGCGGGRASPRPDPTPSVVGTYDCRAVEATAGDTVEVRADGTLTITKRSGESASGTWTVDGPTFTTHWVGRGGEEDFTIQGDVIVGTNGFTCKRTP